MRQPSLTKFAVLSRKAPGTFGLLLKFRVQTLAVPFSSINQRTSKRPKNSITRISDSVPFAQTVPITTKEFVHVDPCEQASQKQHSPTDFHPATYSPFGESSPAAELLEEVSSAEAQFVGVKIKDKFHGKGRLTWKVDHQWRQYHGDFIHGVRTGHGRYRSDSGVMYEGEWVNNKPQGLGKLTIPVDSETTVTCKGPFLNGVLHGQGTLTVRKNSIIEYQYTGSFVHGLKCGLGSSTHSDTSSAAVYDGAYKNNLKEGYGTQTITAPSYSKVYQGDFGANLYNGQGELAYTVLHDALQDSNNPPPTLLERYKAAMNRNYSRVVSEAITLFNYFLWAQNHTYTGAFKDNKFHGQGVLTCEHMKIEGVFTHGVPDGECSVLYPDNSHYKGSFLVLKRVGKEYEHVRLHHYHNGLYEGQYENGEVHGTGKITYPDGTQFVGTFQRNMFYSGEGVYVNKHGIVHEGVWKEGVFTGTKREVAQPELIKEKKGERWPENVSAAVPAVVADAIAEQKPSMTPDGPTIVRKIDNKGIIYEGEFKNGYRHGYGITTYPEGKVYKGNYAYDVRSGYGTLTYPDGNSVTGIFQNNRIYHGKGAVVHDVLIEHGEWLDGVRVGDAMNVKRDGSGIFKGVCENGNAGMYEGAWMDDMQHGEGTYRYREGDCYVGHFQYGKRDGYGVYTHADGGKYEGMWRNHEREGLGKTTNSDGSYYEGTYARGNIVKGTHVYPDGNIYEGEFRKRFMHGKGIITFVDGSVFSGNFHYNQPDKQGKLTSAAGVYVGEIEEFKPHGKGVYEYIDGTVYEGSFMRGQRDGWAKVLYANKNEVLEGQFMFDRLFKGQGVLHNSDGSVYNGEIDNFKYTTGVLTYANGSTYEGTFSDNLPFNGVGCGNVGEKDVYCGNWVDGVATGSGQISYGDGSTYTGEVVKGLKHGQGTFVYADGSVYEATWVENRLHGAGRHTIVDSSGECTGMFEGHWVDGLKQGTGTYTYLNGGRMLVGEYTQGMRNGVHTLMYPSTGYEVQVEYANDTLVENSSVYFKDDLVFEGTPIFEGEWANDKPVKA
eukprot:gene14664-16821_t